MGANCSTALYQKATAGALAAGEMNTVDVKVKLVRSQPSTATSAGLSALGERAMVGQARTQTWRCGSDWLGLLLRVFDTTRLVRWAAAELRGGGPFLTWSGFVTAPAGLAKW